MSTHADKPDLSLIDTDDLINELRKRSQVFYLVARPLGEQEYEWRQHWGGGMERVLGLIELGKARLFKDETDRDED
jgi:hypothetical protein